MLWFGKRSDKRQEDDLQEVRHNLQLMARIESLIAAFYQRCAEAMPDDAAFWREMAENEHRHAEFIGRMGKIVEAHPDRFTPDRNFNAASVRLFEIYVRDLPATETLRGMSRKEIFDLAAEIEKSAIEAEYSRIVKSHHPEFSRLMQEIVAETAAHQQLLKEKSATV